MRNIMNNAKQTQLDFLKEAVLLAEQNPDIEIFVASSDEHCDDNGWTRHQITKVEKTLYCCVEEEIFLSAEEIVDHYEGYGEEITEEEAVDKMKEVILIYTGV